jgi:hypothetical protein
MNKIEYDETSDFHNLFILIPYLSQYKKRPTNYDNIIVKETQIVKYIGGKSNYRLNHKRLVHDGPN